MSIKSFIAVCSAFVAATAFAQQERLGTVDSVQGIVTVTDWHYRRHRRHGQPHHGRHALRRHLQRVGRLAVE